MAPVSIEQEETKLTFIHHVLVLLYYCFDRIFPLKVELDKVITYTDRGGAKGAERGQLSALTPQNFSAIY